MALHIIEPERKTLHGQFSSDLAPVVTIDSGDTVRYRTIDVGWGLESPVAPNQPRRKFGPRIPEQDDGPALCGPIAIHDAKPGMVLAIHIEVVQPDTWGWTYVSGKSSPLSTAVGLGEHPLHLVRWHLDTTQMIGTNQHGHTVALRPFLGTIGVTPAGSGWHSAWPPRTCGGNMDCSELVAGSTLYLPIEVAGALVSVGDGHAVQGDGEVCGMAIECPMERVELRYVLHDDLHITSPRAHTPAGWLTMGFDQDLHTATVQALNAMLDLMEEQFQITRADAFALASVAVHLRTTQLVNVGICGAHAILPHDAIRQ